MAEERALLIDGRKLTKVFKDFWGRPKVTAVRDLDLAVPEGTVFGLLGPNGAGKSTTMKMILGHLYPTRGQLSVLGQSPRTVETKKRMGYLPERTAFYNNLTAVETLKLFGDILKLPNAEIARRTDQLLEMVGLQNARQRLVGEFSHGMGRRLGLAQALLNDPDLLLLDEPTAGMDPIGCYEVKQLILTLAKRGKTIVMSSHLLSDVQDVCNQIMIIYGGRVQQVGQVKDLLACTNEVQIRVPAVSAGALEKARAALGEEIASEKIEVSYPTRTLENYFLEIVRQADRSQQETAGAKVGSGVADYLSGGVAAQEVLDALTQPETPKPAPAADTAAPPAPAVDTDAIQALTQDEAPEKPADSAKKAPEIDRSLLDSLTKNDH
jgi:ABC-2 type transport system ATP-binding protein